MIKKMIICCNEYLTLKRWLKYFIVISNLKKVFYTDLFHIKIKNILKKDNEMRIDEKYMISLKYVTHYN